ncbi:STAS domain-containing protein (plasmid) [Hymenobacter tibetensis]|uniref:STAS domain-containing protein n=1 Tax=Hymenobacter tibetensis TaxID=497967 RepID=A0ABY4D5Q7_9BACT|nr:STAS domain-containing protein [Hymenobacter tibetensis]UOG77683.1 STAS domain-containing protein [Hymenobacter tibetensis]
MVVYHEALPTGYLLALAPDAGATTETELADHLEQACRSGRPAVWVDCRLLDTLSPTAVWLLWSCQLRLRRRGIPMILCGASARVQQVLQQTLAGISAGLPQAQSLDEAVAFTVAISRHP